MSEVEIKKLSPLSLLMKKCKQNKTKKPPTSTKFTVHTVADPGLEPVSQWYALGQAYENKSTPGK